MEQCIGGKVSRNLLADRHTERQKLNITRCWVEGSGNVYLLFSQHHYVLLLSFVFWFFCVFPVFVTKFSLQ